MLPGNVRAHPFEASLAKRPAGTRPHGGGPKLRRLGERRKAARGPSPRSSRLGHLTLGTGTAGGCPPVASGCRQRPGRGCREGGAVPPRGTGRPPAPGWPLDVREGAPASACGPAFAGRPSGEAESLPARGRRGAPAGAGERAGGGWVGGWGGERGAAAPRGRWRAGADRQRPASRRRAAGSGLARALREAASGRAGPAPLRPWWRLGRTAALYVKRVLVLRSLTVGQKFGELSCGGWYDQPAADLLWVSIYLSCLRLNICMELKATW